MPIYCYKSLLECFNCAHPKWLQIGSTFIWKEKVYLAVVVEMLVATSQQEWVVIFGVSVVYSSLENVIIVMSILSTGLAAGTTTVGFL